MPARRELAISPNRCVQISDDLSFYMILSCDYGSGKYKTSVEIYKSDDTCSDDNSLVSTRELNNEECKPWLFSNETGLGFAIYGEVKFNIFIIYFALH